ncbi:DUF1559 domain-containing protein [Paludisphaera rhizosphaerae]|uniref:DUF1559 domain-containing protein n=1 Tax=Paludisphaera rhizosphaerae TaxID=2711216 RepID=UPI00389945B6
MSAREAARRLQCQNNLKQIGLALTAYESVGGCFPPINLPSITTKTGRSVSMHYYSASTRILPYLEMRNLSNGINFNLSPSNPISLRSNSTVMRTPVDIFLCQSDISHGLDGYGRTNYRYNIGPSPWFSPVSGRDSGWSGAFTVHKTYQPADFPDGLSQTVGLSERLQGDWIRNHIGAGDYALLQSGDRHKHEPTQWIRELCRALAPDVARESRGGESWFVSGLHFTNYNHFETPNSNVSDCALDSGREGLHQRTLHDGIFSARSRHTGGVNLLMMDGSVKFCRDTVDLRVWHAIGSRNGQELSSLEMW